MWADIDTTGQDSHTGTSQSSRQRGGLYLGLDLVFELTGVHYTTKNAAAASVACFPEVCTARWKVGPVEQNAKRDVYPKPSQHLNALAQGSAPSPYTAARRCRRRRV